MKFGMGQSVRRTEDIRFITGQGQYTDDLKFENQSFAAFHRSPHGHAKILSVDVSQAKKAPGVIAVLTQDDIQPMGVLPMPCIAPIKNRDGSNIVSSVKPLLAKDRVTFVGEAIVMVVADTYAQAVDAAELVAVEYEALDAAGTLETAPTGPQIWDNAPGNLIFDWVTGDEAATNAGFAKAAHTVSVDVVQNRIVVNSMETRNAIGTYDGKEDSFVLYSGTQGASGIRDRIVKMIWPMAVEKLKVITRDVGGGFGMKNFVYPEQILVLIGAKVTGRPVRWSADRTEGFLSDDGGRDFLTRGELALDAQGKILAMRMTGSANMGGYLSQFGPGVATMAGGRIFGGLYRVPALFANIKGYFSNTGPVDAYRGAGRPESAYLIERLMDIAAQRLKMDRAEIRRINMPTPEELPYKSWSGAVFDSGDFPRLLAEGLSRADVTGFEKRKAESKSRGQLRGLGIGYYVEITATQGQEPAKVVFTDNGGVELYLGTQSNGQGHETTFAQMVSEKLGVPFESITVKQGDSSEQIGGGTGGSRSLTMSGAALFASSDEVIRKGKDAAAQVLQAGGKEIGFDVVEGVGRFAVEGTGQSIGLVELAMTLKRENIPGFEKGLDSDGAYMGAAPSFPNGCHVCEVEADPETGHVKILSYKVLDDFGRVINPLLVEGQVHGGVVQGLGQALLEHAIYDASSGQMLTASFTDYAMPRAGDMPDIDFAYEEILCKTNPLGTKGCGEAGTVGALPAFISALTDALGVEHIDMPATPEKVWRAAQGTGRSH